MTVREVAAVLGVTDEAIKKHIRELWPELMRNGERTYLTEEQVTEIKQKMTPTTKVVGALTSLDIERMTVRGTEDAMNGTAEHWLLKPDGNGSQAVSARELHAALGAGRDFSTWVKDRIEKYGFMEGRDYQKFDSPELGNQTGRAAGLITPKTGENQVEQSGWGGKREGAGKPRGDYLLTLSAAKELAIVENNEKGREIRLYLIKVEEAWNSPQMVMARALQIADRELKNSRGRIAHLELKVENDRPKVAFFDKVADSGDALSMREAAAVLNMPGWGRNKIFMSLRKAGVLDGRNIPYREYQERGYFRVVERKWTDPEGETHVELTTLVYQRGIDFIRQKLTEAAA
jgi:anti-repressor protein